MKNILKAVQGQTTSFSVYHEQDEEEYTLADDEIYQMKIKRSLNDSDEEAAVWDSVGTDFDVDTSQLETGEYYFEISLVSSGSSVVISPATDINGNKNNILYVTEKL